MEFKLKDLVNIKYGKNQKNVKNPRGEYPILGTGGIMDYADDFLYDKPSVLIGRKGSIGKVKYIEEPFWTIDTLFYTIVNENLVIPKYLYYKLSQIDFNYYNEGTTIPSLRTETLYKIDIDLPKKNIQKKVVNLLNTIDEKIENNQKIIANLEELSQTLFKRWFVDFEFPDENGNPYKSSGGEMIDSELGEIPKSWNIVKLKDIAEHRKESFNPKKTNESEVVHFSLPAFDANQTPVIDDVNDIKSNKWIVDDNCILFSKMNPSTRRTWLTSNDNNHLNVASSEFVVLKSDNSYKNAFIYNICLSDNFNEFLVSNTTGSTNSRQRVKPDIALNYKFTFNKVFSSLFSKNVEPLLEKIIIMRKENQRLTALRDTLLPKLMSGEIEIPDDIEVNKDELSI